MNKQNKGENLAERLLDFAVRIIKVVNALPKTGVGKHISGQLVRSGTSPGANYEEARGAESRSDFIHKLGIVLKELKESRFWLRVIHRGELLAPARVEPVMEECEELCAIIGKSVLTARTAKKH
jgi:four helix bundle protein